MKPVLYSWLLIGMLAVGCADLCFADDAVDSATQQVQQESPQTEEKTDPRDDPAFQREMVEAMFLTAIFVVAGFFLFVLMITVVRMNRHNKNRMKIGQKGDKTEYIDAWSRYKLKEDEKN